MSCLLSNVSRAEEEDPCTVERSASEAKARRGVQKLSKGRARVESAMSGSALHDDEIRRKKVANSCAHT